MRKRGNQNRAVPETFLSSLSRSRLHSVLPLFRYRIVSSFCIPSAMEGQLVKELCKLVQAGHWERSLLAMHGCVLGGFMVKDLPFRPLHSLLVSKGRWEAAVRLHGSWVSASPSDAACDYSAVSHSVDHLLGCGRWQQASALFLAARRQSVHHNAHRGVLRDSCLKLLVATDARPDIPQSLRDLLTVYASLESGTTVAAERVIAAAARGDWSTAIAILSADPTENVPLASRHLLALWAAADALSALSGESRSKHVENALTSALEGVKDMQDPGEKLTVAASVFRLVSAAAQLRDGDPRAEYCPFLHLVRPWYSIAPAYACKFLQDLVTAETGARMSRGRSVRRVAVQSRLRLADDSLPFLTTELEHLCRACSTLNASGWLEVGTAVAGLMSVPDVFAAFIARAATTPTVLRLCAHGNSSAFIGWGVAALGSNNPLVISHKKEIRTLLTACRSGWSLETARSFAGLLLAERSCWEDALRFCLSATKVLMAEHENPSERSSLIQQLVEMIVQSGGYRKWDHALQICNSLPRSLPPTNICRLDETLPEIPTDTELIDMAEHCHAAERTQQWWLAAEVFSRFQRKISRAQHLWPFEYSIRRSHVFAGVVARHMLRNGLRCGPTALSILQSARNFWRVQQKLHEHLSRRHVVADVYGMRKVAQRETMQLAETALSLFPTPVPLNELTTAGGIVTNLAAECDGGDAAEIIHRLGLADSEVVSAMQADLERTISLCADAGDTATALTTYNNHRKKCPFVPVPRSTYGKLFSLQITDSKTVFTLARDFIGQRMLHTKNVSDVHVNVTLLTSLCRNLFSDVSYDTLVCDLLREVAAENASFVNYLMPVTMELVQAMRSASPQNESIYRKWCQQLHNLLELNEVVPYTSVGRLSRLWLDACLAPAVQLRMMSADSFRDPSFLEAFCEVLRFLTQRIQSAIDNEMILCMDKLHQPLGFFSAKILIVARQQSQPFLERVSPQLELWCAVLDAWHLVASVEATAGNIGAAARACAAAAAGLDSLLTSGLSPIAGLWTNLPSSLQVMKSAESVAFLLSKLAPQEIFAASSFSAVADFMSALVTWHSMSVQLQLGAVAEALLRRIREHVGHSTPWGLLAAAVSHAATAADRTVESYVEEIRTKAHACQWKYSPDTALQTAESLIRVATTHYTSAVATCGRLSLLVTHLVAILSVDRVMSLSRLISFGLERCRSAGALGVGLSISHLPGAVEASLARAAQRSRSSLESLCGFICDSAQSIFESGWEAQERETALLCVLEKVAAELPFRVYFALRLIHDVHLPSDTTCRQAFAARAKTALTLFGPWAAHTAANLILQCHSTWSSETLQKVLAMVDPEGVISLKEEPRPLEENTGGVAEWALHRYDISRWHGLVHLAILSAAEKKGVVTESFDAPLNVTHKLLSLRDRKISDGPTTLRHCFDSIASLRQMGIQGSDFLSFLKHPQHNFLSIRALFNTSHAVSLLKKQLNHENKWKVLRHLEATVLRVVDSTKVSQWPPNEAKFVAPSSWSARVSPLEQFAAAAAFSGAAEIPVSSFTALVCGYPDFNEVIALLSLMPTLAIASACAREYVLNGGFRKHVTDSNCLHEFAESVLSCLFKAFGEPTELEASAVSVCLMLAVAVFQEAHGLVKDDPRVHAVLRCSQLVSPQRADVTANFCSNALSQEQLDLCFQLVPCWAPVCIPWDVTLRGHISVPDDHDPFSFFSTSCSAAAASAVVRRLFADLKTNRNFQSVFGAVDCFLSTGRFNKSQASGSPPNHGCAQEVVDTYMECLHSEIMQLPSLRSKDVMSVLRLSIGRIANRFGLSNARGEHPYWPCVPKRSLKQYLRILVTTRRQAVVDSTACDHILATLRMEQHQSLFPGDYRCTEEVCVLFRFFLTALRHFLHTIEPDDAMLEYQDISASCAFNCLVEYLHLLHARHTDLDLLENHATQKAVAAVFGNESVDVLKTNGAATPRAFLRFISGAWRRAEVPDSAISLVLSHRCYSLTISRLQDAVFKDHEAGFVVSAIQLSRILNWFVFHEKFDELLGFFVALGNRRPCVMLSGAVNAVAVAALHSRDMHLVAAAVDEIVRKMQFQTVEMSAFALGCLTHLHFQLRLSGVLWWLLRQWRRVPSALVRIALDELPGAIRKNLLGHVEAELADPERDVLLDAPLQHLHTILEPHEGRHRRQLFTYLVKGRRISWRRAAYLLRRECIYDATFKVENDGDLAIECVVAVAATGDRQALAAMWQSALALVVKMHTQCASGAASELIVAATRIAANSDAPGTLQTNAFFAAQLLASTADVHQWLPPLCRQIAKFPNLSFENGDSVNAILSVVKLAIRHSGRHPQLSAFVETFLQNSCLPPNALLALLREESVVLQKQTIIAIGNRLHALSEHEVLLRFLDMVHPNQAALHVLEKPIRAALAAVCPGVAEKAFHTLTMDIAGVTLRDLLDSVSLNQSVVHKRFYDACGDRLFDDAAAILLHHPAVMKDEKAQKCMWILMSRTQNSAIVQIIMPLLSHALANDRLSSADALLVLGSTSSAPFVALALSAFLGSKSLSTPHLRAFGVLLAAGILLLARGQGSFSDSTGLFSIDLAETATTSLNSHGSALVLLTSVVSGLKAFSSQMPLAVIGQRLPVHVLDALTAVTIDLDLTFCCSVLAFETTNTILCHRKAYCVALADRKKTIGDGSLWAESVSSNWLEALASLHAAMQLFPTAVVKDGDSFAQVTTHVLTKTGSLGVVCRLMELAQEETGFESSTLRPIEEAGSKALTRLLSFAPLTPTVARRAASAMIRQLQRLEPQASPEIIHRVLDNLLQTLKVFCGPATAASNAAVAVNAYRSVLDVTEKNALDEDCRTLCMEVVSLIRPFFPTEFLARPEASWQIALRILTRAWTALPTDEGLASRQFEALIPLAAPNYEALLHLCRSATSRLASFSEISQTRLLSACTAHYGAAGSERIALLLKLNPAIASRAHVEETLGRALAAVASWEEAVALVSLTKSRGSVLSAQIYDQTLQTAQQLVGDNGTQRMPCQVLASLLRGRVADEKVPLSLKFCEASCALVSQTDLEAASRGFDEWCGIASSVGITFDSAQRVFETALSLLKRSTESRKRNFPTEGTSKLFSVSCATVQPPHRLDAAATNRTDSLLSWLEAAAPIMHPTRMAELSRMACALFTDNRPSTDETLRRLLLTSRHGSLVTQQEMVKVVAPLFSSPCARWLCVAMLAASELKDVSAFRQRYNALQGSAGLGTFGTLLVDIASGCLANPLGNEIPRWAAALQVFIKALPTAQEDLTPALGAVINQMLDANILGHVTGDLHLFSGHGRVLCVDANILSSAVAALLAKGSWWEALRFLESSDLTPVPDNVKSVLLATCCKTA
jgi:hypothetical protein